MILIGLDEELLSVLKVKILCDNIMKNCFGVGCDRYFWQEQYSYQYSRLINNKKRTFIKIFFVRDVI